MKFLTALLVLFLSLLSSSIFADDTSVRHVVWDKSPIQIVLPVGVEKRIEFPEPVVDILIPPNIADPISRTQLTPDGRLYWLATKPWEVERIRVETVSGYFYLLDVQASDKAGEPNPLIIEHDKESDKQNDPEKTAEPEGYDYVDLSRYAAQHMHGPARLIKPLPGVRRVPVEHRVIPLYRGNELEVMPVAQWHSPNPPLYITALKLVNLTAHSVEITPLNLRGQWLWSAPHHPSVMPRGSLGDESFYYVVSDQPYNQAIGKLSHRRAAKPLKKTHSSERDDALSGFME
ncbi:MAG: hypothetical protein DSZ28_06700 [Thiothrix sp.]|nr:MAG: hypothetical protein DSZ28_06700 [Thiothrix sp.]